MKKIFLSIFLALGLLTSCDMDKTPAGALDDQNALQSVNDFARFRNGIYSSIRSLCSGSYLYSIDIQSDQFLGLSTAGNRSGSFNNKLITPSDQDVTAMFQGVYARIASTNYFLGHAETAVAVEGRFTETQMQDMKRYIAEAKFARAYYYWWLMDRFCKAPTTANANELGLQIVTVFNPTGDSSSYPGRSTLGETLTFINDELTAAYNDLKAFETIDNSNLKSQAPYVNSLVVRSLQARLALVAGNYDNAKTYANDVIISGVYTLANCDNYIDMWTDNKSDELIFVPFTNQSESGSVSSIAYGYISYQDNETASYIPTMDVLNSYSADDVRLGSFFTQWSLNFEGEYENAMVFFKYPGNASIISGQNQRKTIPMPFRLSEQYLIFAEASAATAGGEGAANTALNTLRKNRIQGWTAQDYSGTALIDQIREERGKELIGEGFRISDLRRWGLGFTRDGSYYNPAVEDYIVSLCLNCVYMPNDDMYVWPIPTDEMEINPQLAGQQNPGYGN